MKKITFIVTLLILAMSVSVWGNPIDSTTAKQMAQRFWAAKCNRSGIANFQNVATAAGFSQFYIFNNLNGPGFVIISADDIAIPVLAYSDANNFNTAQMPINVRDWLTGYENAIRSAVENAEPASADIAMQWQRLAAGNLPTVPTRDAVAPWLTTMWDQEAPYNNLCPGSGSNKSFTGCVATAMAQVMKFHNWPAQGTGSHSYTSPGYGTQSANFGNTTYDWANMHNTYTASSSGTSVNAVATLMYHCGVAVEMEYGSDGSAAYVANGTSPSAENALKTYFGYANTLHYEFASSYTNAQWINRLKTNLHDTMPLIYSGSSSDGYNSHAFVCDGYDNSNNFHFNWGWSGICDGYYAISNLTPTGIGESFSSYQMALFGIRPNIPGSIYNIQMRANMVPTPNPLQRFDGVNVAITLSNRGDVPFSGQLRLTLENENGNILQVLSLCTLSSAFSAGASGTITLPGTVGVAPGNYKMALYSKASDESIWHLVGDDLGYDNPMDVTVINGSMPNVNMYSNLNVTPNPLVRTEDVSASVTIANIGDGAFIGDLKLVLETEDAQEVQVIDQFTSDMIVKHNHSHSYEFNGTVTADAGNYKLALYYQPAGETTWTLVGRQLNYNYANPINIEVTEPVGIPAFAQTDILLYPNPTADRISLQFDGILNRVELLSTTGQSIVMMADVSTGTEIDLSELPAGIYFVRLTNDNGTITRKIVKR